jgi:hypothetical protein
MVSLIEVPGCGAVYFEYPPGIGLFRSPLPISKTRSPSVPRSSES